MQIEALKKDFDVLQKKFGSSKLRAIYGAGCTLKPKVCFVFMNPTGRNVAAVKDWDGLRAPWLGTKNIWKLFYQLELIKNSTYKTIQKMKPHDWNPAFAQEVYKELQNKKVYVTNLSKATQEDARPLPDSIFKNYLSLFKKELSILQPKLIITFGNQVSSIILEKPINVSLFRKTSVPILINNRTVPLFPVYYPVGQGMRNIEKAIEDIKYVFQNG